MYNNLLLYRNELKIKSIPRYKILGIITELLYSKKIFLRNSDINDFLREVFAIEYKSYVIKSRTLIVAKTCRYIEEIESVSVFQKKLYKFICDKINQWEDEESIKKKNTFDGWID